jgi:hypothetical protein
MKSEETKKKIRKKEKKREKNKEKKILLLQLMKLKLNRNLKPIKSLRSLKEKLERKMQTPIRKRNKIMIGRIRNLRRRKKM